MEPIIYHLTEADIAAGNDLWRRRQIKPSALVAIPIFFAIVIFAVVQLFELPATAPDILIMAAAATAAVIALFLFGKWRSRRTALRYFRESPGSHQQITLTWTETHLTVTTPDSYQNRPWSDARSWAENDEVIALLGAGPIFVPLPKRVLTDEHQEDIRACLRRAGVPEPWLFPI